MNMWACTKYKKATIWFSNRDGVDSPVAYKSKMIASEVCFFCFSEKASSMISLIEVVPWWLEWKESTNVQQAAPVIQQDCETRDEDF